MKNTDIKSNMNDKSTVSQKTNNVDKDMNKNVVSESKINVDKKIKTDKPIIQDSDVNHTSRSSGKVESVSKTPLSAPEKLTKEQATNASMMGQTSHKTK